MSVPRATDWRILGLEPGARPDEVRRAWRRRRELYGDTSLATYGLLGDDERRETLARLDRAFEAILGEPPSEARPPIEEPETPPQVTGPPPPLENSPGAYLRHLRLAKGLSLDQIARETRIRRALLELLEEERFEQLPAVVYVRGFVVQVARLLDAPDDPDDVAREFVRRLDDGSEPEDAAP
jgi:flagellar biosynthesis protein FlhG